MAKDAAKNSKLKAEGKKLKGWYNSWCITANKDNENIMKLAEEEKKRKPAVYLGLTE